VSIILHFHKNEWEGDRMERGMLFSVETSKSIEKVIEGLKEKAPEYGFQVRHVLNLGDEYRAHGADVEEGFQIYQVIICSFKRSYQAVKANNKRSVVLLLPKQMTVYRKGEKTVVDYLPFPKDFIVQILPDDEEFAERLAATCQKITRLIESAV